MTHQGSLLLRAEGADRPLLAAAPGEDGPPAIVLAGAKGGVGRSVLSVLLAARWAREGRRVLLLDGALNEGALHVLLDAPDAVPLAAVATGRAEPGALVRAVAPNLSLIAGDTGSDELYGLSLADRARLQLRLSGLFDDYDAVIVDAGSGLEATVRALAMRATRLVAVTTPEATALTLTYALVKTVVRRLPALPMDAWVTRARDAAEGHAAWRRLDEATQRFLERGVGELGAVLDSPALAARARHPGGLLEPAPDDVRPALERAADLLLAPRLAPVEEIAPGMAA